MLSIYLYKWTQGTDSTEADIKWPIVYFFSEKIQFPSGQYTHESLSKLKISSLKGNLFAEKIYNHKVVG